MNTSVYLLTIPVIFAWFPYKIGQTVTKLYKSASARIFYSTFLTFHTKYLHFCVDRVKLIVLADGRCVVYGMY